MDAPAGAPRRPLHEAVARLAAAATEEFEVEDMLGRLCDAAGDTFDVDFVGVMGVDLDRSRFVRASHSALHPVEEIQSRLQMGPCADAIAAGHLVTAATDHEIALCWPAFHVETARQGIEAVASLPLLSRGRCWGVIDLYWTRPYRMGADELASLQLLADVAVSYLVMAADRAVARTAQEQLANRALHDQLTGLPNRGLIHELLFHALAAAARRGCPVAVLFVDLDGFKGINDSFGHAAGDTVLQEVGRRLRATVRTGDAVGRLSGDEFVVVCEQAPGDGDLSIEAASVADRIGRAVAEPVELASGALTVSVTASVGVAVTRDRPSAADLIHRADAAMYEAKALGPGRHVLHTDVPSDDERRGRRSTERELFEALARREFAVHYQPVVDAGRRVVAAEALLRWTRPGRGVVPAGEFIDIAESTGAIVPIGHWLIRQALADLSRWRSDHPASAPELVLCNLSPRELIDPELPLVIDASLAAAGLTPDRLGLEIVESHLADPRLLETVTRLHRAGHPLAIDDFGTGYSSLARLVDMPVALLKIDRSLVCGLPDDARSRTLVGAILTIARELGVAVIGEGVETEGQAAHLVSAGNTLLQGHLVGRPVPAAEFVTTHVCPRRDPDVPDERGEAVRVVTPPL